MSEKLKVAIIGCGARGKLSFGAMLKEREDCEVTALHDTNIVRLKHMSGYLGGRTYTNLEESSNPPHNRGLPAENPGTKPVLSIR